MGPEQLQPFRARVDLGVMVMMGYSTRSRFSKLKSRFQMRFSVIHNTSLFGGDGGSLSLQGDTVSRKNQSIKIHHYCMTKVILSLFGDSNGNLIL